jgi:hypothetical protein
MKTKITTTTHQVSTIEVELPYFSKISDSMFFKVCSETEALEVITGGIFQMPSISTVSASIGLNDSHVISTEQEFEIAFAKTLLKIKQLKFKK